MEQTPVLILRSDCLLDPPTVDRAKDRGSNSIGSRLNRMEDKVGICATAVDQLRKIHSHFTCWHQSAEENITFCLVLIM